MKTELPESAIASSLGTEEYSWDTWHPHLNGCYLVMSCLSIVRSFVINPDFKRQLYCKILVPIEPITCCRSGTRVQSPTLSLILWASFMWREGIQGKRKKKKRRTDSTAQDRHCWGSWKDVKGVWMRAWPLQARTQSSTLFFTLKLVISGFKQIPPNTRFYTNVLSKSTCKLLQL